KVTIWYQAIAFIFLTIAEILISVTGLELAFVVAPPSMKSFITSLWLLTVGIANLFIDSPITRFYKVMHPENYFLVLTLALIGISVASIFVMGRFNSFPALQSKPEMDPVE